MEQPVETHREPDSDFEIAVAKFLYPPFNQHLGLQQRIEDLAIQQFVAQLAVERPVVFDIIQR